MSDLSGEWLWSPACPWCGDEVTDDPDADFGVTGTYGGECGGCGKPVTVEARVNIVRRAYRRTTGGGAE